MSVGFSNPAAAQTSRMKRRVVATEPARQSLIVATLPVRATQWIVRHTEAGEKLVELIPVAAQVTGVVAEISPVSTFVLVVGNATYEGLEGALKAEERNLKADLDR